MAEVPPSLASLKAAQRELEALVAQAEAEAVSHDVVDLSDVRKLKQAQVDIAAVIAGHEPKGLFVDVPEQTGFQRREVIIEEVRDMLSGQGDVPIDCANDLEAKG